MSRRKTGAVIALLVACVVCLVSMVPGAARAAPSAALVMDARTGQILYESNARTRLHPASLTKMMTLYIAFEAVQRGEIDLDTRVRISQKAASEPPTHLGLRAGQRVEFRHLIRAAAIRSANDAATAIGEALSGSEEAFARRMTRTADALGMSQTTFRNAHGLTASGHLSTAYDMTILGRHLIYDFPQYYNIFGRTETVADGRTIRSTNRAFLNTYNGADGIKTGFTNAAGWNLVGSAERNGVRIIATVFGGGSAASRNRRVMELLDLGFDKAPSRVTVRPPSPPSYAAPRGPLAPTRSLRPEARPSRTPDPALIAALEEGVAAAVAAAQEAELAIIAPAMAEPPPERPDQLIPEAATRAPDPDLVEEPVPETPEAPPMEFASATELAPPVPTTAPMARSDGLRAVLRDLPQYVERPVETGAADWSIRIGKFGTEDAAHRALVRVALRESVLLRAAARDVRLRGGSFDARFSGLSATRAEAVCDRLKAQRMDCEAVAPG